MKKLAGKIAVVTGASKGIGLLTVAFLLSVTSTIQLDETSIAIADAPVFAQTPQNRKDEADRLYQLGSQRLKQGQYREALQPLEQALGIYRAIGDRKNEGSTLNNIGRVYSNRGDYSQALKYYEQSLAICQEVGDKLGEGITLSNIGAVYDNLGQYTQALKYYEQSLIITRQIDNKTGEGIALNNIGLVYSNLGQYNQALKYYEQALIINRQINNKLDEGTILSNIGAVHVNLGQYDQALKYYEQALNIVKEVGNKAGQGTTLNNMGLVYKNLGNYDQALKYYEQALVITRETGNRAGEGITLNNIGSVYDNLGQYPQALKYYEQALIIAKEIGNKPGEGITLSNIGLVYRNLGEYSQALKFYEQALVIHRQIGNKSGEGNIFNNMGQVYDDLGQYSDALKSYTQALTIRQKIGEKAGEGTTLNNIGTLYSTLGQYTQALNYYKQALAIRRQVGDKAGEGTTLSNMGQVYDKLGQYSDAVKSYEQALDIFKQVGDKAGEGITLNNLGAVYDDLGKYDQALNYYEQALVIRRKIGDKAGEGTTLSNMGVIYDNLGQYAQGLKLYQQAFVIHQQLGDKVGEGIALNNIGYVYNVLGQYAEAEKSLFAAIKIAESVRPGLSDEHKVSIFETQAHTYRLLQQALVAQNKVDAALEVAERGRSRAFVELLAQRQFANNQLTVQPLSLQQIQRIAKEQNATLVEYSIVQDAFKNQGKVVFRDSVLYIWAVKPTGELVFKQVDLKPLKISLKDLVSSSRDSIGARGRSSIIGVVPRPGTEQRQEANQAENLLQLHQLLIEPIAQFLPTNPSDRVVFIPYQELFLVPFPALKDASGKYLIEKHTILTAPAIQVLDLTRKQRTTRILNRDSRMRNGADVLIVGNPTMPSISPKIGEPRQQLTPLPGAETEAKAIASLLNTKALIGNQATKTTVMQQMQKARIIHLATHGLLDDFKGLGVPGAIALAPSGNDNGLLTSSEIFDLKLNAELVVLSACDTGRGTITGDGVIGLSRSLITAGVPSVVVSLWAVPDAPTASLMSEFYTQMKGNPDKAQALRQAMLATMKQHPNPRNWAAFTLIGEAE